MPPTKRKPASISLYKSHHRVTDSRPDPDEELRIHLIYGPSFLATKSSGVFRATSCLGRLGSPGSVNEARSGKAPADEAPGSCADVETFIGGRSRSLVLK